MAEKVKRIRRKSKAVTIIGLCLLLVGVGLLGWVGYQYFGTNVVAERHFESEKEKLREQWSKPAPPPAPETGMSGSPGPQSEADTAAIPPIYTGEAVALLRIPRFGDDYEVPMVYGTTLEVLAHGVGIYEQSAQPGEIGNFSIAGHRVTHGEPFRRLMELRPGDEIIVETRESIFTYVLDTAPADLTVDETETWVLDPVPGKTDQEPTEALITLTTCQDLFHSPDRSVAFGHLESAITK